MNKQIEKTQKEVEKFNAKSKAEDEAYIDKKIAEYLKRARKIRQEFEGGLRKLTPSNQLGSVVNEDIEIAKMIQIEEHRKEN